MTVAFLPTDRTHITHHARFLAVKKLPDCNVTARERVSLGRCVHLGGSVIVTAVPMYRYGRPLSGGDEELTYSSHYESTIGDSPTLMCCEAKSPIVDDDRSIEEVLDTIGDEHARRVLAAVSREPKSAKELASECDLSLPTVYRRIEILEEHELVKDRTLVAEDGNHYKVYESNFESTVISLEDDEYRVRIYREENLPDRFSQLWDELNPD
jgi:DNA-binding transcriptional ArsR family regulator